MQWEIWGLLCNLTHLRQIGGFLAAAFILLKGHSEIMTLSISSLHLSGLGNRVMSGRGENTLHWDFPVHYQSTTQPESSFPTNKPDPFATFQPWKGWSAGVGNLPRLSGGCKGLSQGNEWEPEDVQRRVGSKIYNYTDHWLKSRQSTKGVEGKSSDIGHIGSTSLRGKMGSASDPGKFFLESLQPESPHTCGGERWPEVEEITSSW